MTIFKPLAPSLQDTHYYRVVHKARESVISLLKGIESCLLPGMPLLAHACYARICWALLQNTKPSQYLNTSFIPSPSQPLINLFRLLSILHPWARILLILITLGPPPPTRPTFPLIIPSFPCVPLVPSVGRDAKR